MPNVKRFIEELAFQALAIHDTNQGVMGCVWHFYMEARSYVYQGKMWYHSKKCD